MTVRDYSNIDVYLNQLQGDIYPQPSDPGHTEWRKWIFDNWISQLFGVTNMLDLGCGDGFCQSMAAELGIHWTGVTLGEDYKVCKDKGLDVLREDFTFLSAEPSSYDLLCSFHSLEHSFSPLLSLMEWHRISKAYLCVVLPNPKHFTFEGKNHYGVMLPEQFTRLCKRAGWQIIWENTTDFELRYMCQKVKPEIL